MFRHLTCALMLALFVCYSGNLRSEDEAPKPADRFVVPEKDVAALVEFLTELESYKPKSTEEIVAYRKHARKAFETAANRILNLEKDKSSNAYRKASAIEIQLGLSELQAGNKESQQGFYERVLAHLKSAKAMSQQDLGLAYTFGQIVEKTGNTGLAKEAYAEFGKLFSASKDETLQEYGEKMTGISRRLDLPGKKMKLEGDTISGKPFDWESYQGKVVLVDYWATWCGPCIQELPNVKENYEKYRDKGFEVVGISLDSDPNRLQSFITEREIPWICLFQEGSGWNHPMAKYYGVMGIPATMLLDREGKVVAMNVRGGELGRHLDALLGPIESSE